MKWASKAIKNGLCHYDCHYHWSIIQIEGSVLLSRCPFTVESWAPPSEEMELGNLRKRREQKKILHFPALPSLSLQFLACSFSISSISFSSLFISSFYNSSFSVPLLSLFCLVLSCIGMYFDAVEGSLIVGIRPRSNTDLSSPPCLDSHHMYHHHHHHHHHHYHPHHSITIGFIIKLTIIIAINTI